METKNNHDLLSLIKITPNMEYWGGGDLAFAHICHNIYIYIYISKRVKKGSKTKTKVKGKRHTMASIHLFVSISFFKLRFD
jgi:hypothetical protein